MNGHGVTISIGTTIFTEKTAFQIVARKGRGCGRCHFGNGRCLDSHRLGECTKEYRTDNTNVIFKKIK